MSTARDVTTGTNHPNFGNAAVVGPDTATGNGLVDAHKAVLLAKLRCVATPVAPVPPSASEPGAGPGSLSQDDLAAIERMIIESDVPRL